ncbi:hypothetical protein TNCT_575381 [Trichonephila clavata]|uniref:Uncharacterized protein n=1 Tax=Trichonephila clavata TaxID=2740835 RepID=A0A8X6LJI3_TRICU|nr:hypothetical protein TNCT_575381 [Trichonephila clavata]
MKPNGDREARAVADDANPEEMKVKSSNGGNPFKTEIRISGTEIHWWWSVGCHPEKPCRHRPTGLEMQLV